jgi:hypothetical protein
VVRHHMSRFGIVMEFAGFDVRSISGVVWRSTGLGSSILVASTTIIAFSEWCIQVTVGILHQYT